MHTQDGQTDTCAHLYAQDDTVARAPLCGAREVERDDMLYV